MGAAYVGSPRLRAYPGRVPLVTYSVLRLTLLAACLGLGYWAGLRTWLLLFVAAFAAWGLSYVLLGRARDAAALYVAARVGRRSGGAPRFSATAEADAAHEDALVDRAVGRPAHDAASSPGGAAPAAHDDGPVRKDGYPDETASPRPNSTP